MNIKISSIQSPCLLPCLLIFFLFHFSACSFLVGYKKLKDIDKTSINSFCEKFKSSDCIVLDTGYLYRLKEIIKDSIEIKNFYQPLKVHYFVDGILKSNLINCYAPGIKNLNWNTENRLSEFPPKSHVQLKNEMSIATFKKLINCNTAINGKNVVFIFWTNAFKKKSDDLALTIISSLEKKSIPYDLILVNSDFLFTQ